jgi:protein phosphatase PTC2/3
METAHVLLQNTASTFLFSFLISVLIIDIAEFRGPGVHHNFDDSDSGYDVDVDSRLRTAGGGNGNSERGRIILLGDGTEVLTDSDDTEMFDHGDEDKDLESQVHKGQVVGQELSDRSQDTLPAKLDVTDPWYKAVADKVHANPAEPVVQAVSETSPDAKDK